MINNEFVILVVELPIAIHFYSYIVVRKQRNCLHDEVRTCWEGCLILTVTAMKVRDPACMGKTCQHNKLCSDTIFLGHSGFLLQRKTQICSAFLFSCTTVCNLWIVRDCTIIWSLPMSNNNSWYHIMERCTGVIILCQSYFPVSTA